MRSIDGGRDCVAYIGTASKILTPSIRLAWMIPPTALRPGIEAAIERNGESSCSVTALALSQFIDSGALSRHLARASRTYAARRAALVGALTQQLAPLEESGIAISGIDAGLHLLLRLPDGVDDAAVTVELGRFGVKVPGLTDYRRSPTGPSGLVCGYARLPEARAQAAAVVIAKVVRRHVH